MDVGPSKGPNAPNREWSEVPLDIDTGRVTAAHYTKSVRADTRIATILHTSPVTGMSTDIAEIAQSICQRAPESIIIVEGIQHAPHGVLNVETYGEEGYVISPYKAFCGVNNGYARVSKRVSVSEHDKMIGKPADARELGSRDPSALIGISAMVDYPVWGGGHFTEAGSRRAGLIAAGKTIRNHRRVQLVHRCT